LENINLSINCNGRLLTFERAAIMGILNTTPDSFYAASRVAETALLAQAEAMLEAGANILDIGGQSTRPNAEIVTEKEELERTTRAIAQIKQHFSTAIISIDTFRASVAKAAVDAGASVVNDISGGRFDANLWQNVANLRTPYILMHSTGDAANLHQKPIYQDIVMSVMDYFIAQIAALRENGIYDIVLDMGFGFGKTFDDNYTLLRRLAEFKILDCPILVGISRKSMIYKPLNIAPEAALAATTALHLLALQNGANILRVHDVAEAVQMRTLLTYTLPTAEKRCR
jgi:dihydropteroate synthase